MCKETSGARTVLIKSVGCRTNQQEMNALRARLEQDGFSVVEKAGDADIVVINTCSVTSNTESKTRRLMSAISSEAPDAKILVTGCMAQQKPSLMNEGSGVHWVVGNTFKGEIASIVSQEQGGGIFHSDFDNLSLDALEVPTVIAPCSKDIRTRFPVKIQEGCDFWCSYCIVPSLRGPSRSASKEKVLKECRGAVDAGHKELVLTGTNIGQFEDGGLGIVDLVKSIVKMDGDFRVRLSSLYPRDLSTELLELVSKEPKICDHLHVSIQSLSRKVLTAMNRAGEDVGALVEKLICFRKSNPYAGLGADFIVGFPGEKDENFQETLNRAGEIGFSYAHIFRYSVRPGTRAASMESQISEVVKSSRSEKLRKVIKESRAEFLFRNSEKPSRIIVESGFPVRGLTSNYIHVEVPGLELEHNCWLRVKVSAKESGRYCPAEPFLQTE